MVKYLYFDGENDKLEIPGSSPGNLTEFEFDFKITLREDWHQVLNFGSKIINFSSNTNNLTYNADFQDIFVDGVKVVNGTPFLKIGQRHVMRGILKSGINTGIAGVIAFSNTVSQWLQGNLYSLKVYQNGVLKSHIDMNTGTVQDQSGNGNHAILTGGTWLDDGTGGTPTGTPGTAIINTKQVIYKPGLVSANTKQIIYKNATVTANLKQVIYKNSTIVANMRQAIYKQGQTSIDMKQAIYKMGVVYVDLLQLIQATNTVTINMKQVIYKQATEEINTLQRIYKSGATDVNLLVRILENYEVYERIIETVFKISREINAEFNIVRELEIEFEIKRELNTLFKI